MARHQIFAPDLTMKAGADLRTNQYYFVKGDGTTADSVVKCAAATDRAVGVLQNKPNTGEAAQIQFLGITPVVSDGSGTAIAAWDLVGPNSAAKAAKKATADYSVAGIALDASSADGTIIRVLLLPMAVFRSLAG